MLTLHMFRHGDTAASADGVLCGERDIPLIASGLGQAESVGVRGAVLKPDALYVSSKLRARQTLEPLARRTTLVPTVREGLREIAYGAWDGRAEKEVEASEPDAYAAWGKDAALNGPPGGETAFAIAARAMEVVEEIRARHEGQVVVLVSHKATIRVITCAFLGIYLGRFRDRVACPPASLTTFELGPKGPLLVRIGETSHLAP